MTTSRCLTMLKQSQRSNTSLDKTKESGSSWWVKAICPESSERKEKADHEMLPKIPFVQVFVSLRVV